MVASAPKRRPLASAKRECGGGVLRITDRDRSLRISDPKCQQNLGPLCPAAHCLDRHEDPSESAVIRRSNPDVRWLHNAIGQGTLAMSGTRRPLNLPWGGLPP